MARVLLTGATGFVGRRVAALLGASGHSVVAIVRDAAACPAGCTPVVADLRDADALAQLASVAADCSVLVHLAASIPQQSVPDDALADMRAANVDTTRRLIAAMPASIDHVVFASTLDVYGVPETNPITEDHPTRPVTAYGTAKRDCEVLIDERARASGFTVAHLRLTQVYGAGEPPIKAIPRFMRMIAAGDTPKLFGDGSELRSYVHVDDAADAFVRAVETRAAGVFNIAGDEAISIASTLGRIIDISGAAITPERHPRAKDKIDMVLDTTRAKRALGFTARVSMDDGLHRQWRALTMAGAGA